MRTRASASSNRRTWRRSSSETHSCLAAWLVSLCLFFPWVACWESSLDKSSRWEAKPIGCYQRIVERSRIQIRTVKQRLDADSYHSFSPQGDDSAGWKACWVPMLTKPDICTEIGQHANAQIDQQLRTSTFGRLTRRTPTTEFMKNSTCKRAHRSCFRDSKSHRN